MANGVAQGATMHEESCTLVAKESSKGIGVFSPDPRLPSISMGIGLGTTKIEPKNLLSMSGSLVHRPESTKARPRSLAPRHRFIEAEPGTPKPETRISMLEPGSIEGGPKTPVLVIAPRCIETGLGAWRLRLDPLRSNSGPLRLGFGPWCPCPSPLRLDLGR